MRKISICNNSLGHFHSHATLLAGNGFTVTPTKGKQPVVRRWQNPRPTDPEWLAKVIASNRYAGCNVGIVCGRVVAIDIDELDPSRAALLKALATEHLGPTQWERIGQAPKTLLMYRPLDDIRPIKIAGCIDVLASGRQFVAYGIHPDTGQPYRWLDSHYNPATAKLEELPPITAADVRAFADAVCMALGQRVNAIPAPTERTVRTTLQSRQRARQGEMLNSPLNARIIRDADGRVVDGREAFLTSLTAAEYAKGFTTPEELAGRVWARFIEGADLSRPRAAIPGRDGPMPMHSPRLVRPSVADHFYSRRGEPVEGIRRAICTHGAGPAIGTLCSGRCIWLRSVAESRRLL